MAFKPKDVIDAARDIVQNAVERSSDIVEDAGHIIKGDIAGGTGDIVHNSLDIATYAVERTKEVFTGPPDRRRRAERLRRKPRRSARRAGSSLPGTPAPNVR